MDKVKLYKSAKEPEIYHYFNANKEKLCMYRHKYYDAAGKRREKKKSGFKTEKAALKALLEVKAATLRGETKHIENDNLTISDYVDVWFEKNCKKKKWSDNSVLIREQAIRLHFKPLLGRYKLQNLNDVIYQENFIDVLAEQYKPSTVHQAHNVFKTIINAAIKERILLHNPLVDIVLPANTKRDETGKKQENYLTPTELVTFLNDAKQNENITNYTFLLVIAYTGMRCGEACGLQWENINFKEHTITIERSRDYGGTHKPKTLNSYRTILVEEAVMKQLETYKKWCKQKLLTYGLKLMDEDEYENDDTFVFISHLSGEPIGPNNTAKIMYKSIQRTRLPKITLHGLRHTHCTILLNRGLNVKVIAERLGNTPKMIYEIYGHVLKEMEEASVAAFSQSLNEVGAKSGASS